MEDKNIYTSHPLQIYPLELFILFVGFFIGFALRGFKMVQKQQNFKEKQDKFQDNTSEQQNNQSQRKKSLQRSINTHSMNVGHSFQIQESRYKLYKGKLYQYLPLNFNKNQQIPNKFFEISISGITKIDNDGLWTKLYDPLLKVPKKGKFYIKVSVVKNEYFVKRQPFVQQKHTLKNAMKLKPSSNDYIAVSRTDIIIGFFLISVSENHDNKVINQSIKQLCNTSQTQSNVIPGILGYGFNGRIYTNGSIHTQQKIIKKNKSVNIFINIDDGYIEFQLQGQTIGYIILPSQNRQQEQESIIIPFVEMYAKGTAIIVSD